jgi:hypothetical protein
MRPPRRTVTSPTGTSAWAIHPGGAAPFVEATAVEKRRLSPTAIPDLDDAYRSASRSLRKPGAVPAPARARVASSMARPCNNSRHPADRPRRQGLAPWRPPGADRLPAGRAARVEGTLAVLTPSQRRVRWRPGSTFSRSTPRTATCCAFLSHRQYADDECGGPRESHALSAAV